MQLAARALADGSDKVATVARNVGYDADAAFSRAFKREKLHSKRAFTTLGEHAV